MFAGHVGAALAISRAERRVNVGVFVLAALLLDVVLWALVLLGWESVVIPANFATSHQLEFNFPYSHGMLAGVGWSDLSSLAAFLWLAVPKEARWRTAVLVAAAVLSHWLLDALVHVPELPLTGVASRKVGFGLWQNMPAALVVEAVLVAAGLGIFIPGSALSGARKSWLSVVYLLVLAFTVAGMTVAPAPPSATAMAASSLLTIILLCALIGWLTRHPG